MEAAAGHDLGDDAVPLAQAIYRETDGNPFFVTELLRHLAESEVIAQDAGGRWTLAGPFELASLPDTVRTVIEARVRRLGPQAERRAVPRRGDRPGFRPRRVGHRCCNV